MKRCLKNGFSNPRVRSHIHMYTLASTTHDFARSISSSFSFSFLFFSLFCCCCFRMAMAIENLHLFLPLEFGSLSLGCTYLRHPLLHFRAADHQLCRTRRRPVPSITSESRSRSTWTELRAWRACNPSSSVPQGRSPVTPPIRNDPNHDLLI